MDWLKKIPIGQYVSGNSSWLRGIDPRIKISWILLFLLSPILANSIWRISIAFVLLLITVLSLLPPRVWWRSLVFLLVFSLIFGFLSIVLPASETSSELTIRSPDEIPEAIVLIRSWEIFRLGPFNFGGISLGALIVNSLDVSLAGKAIDKSPIINEKSNKNTRDRHQSRGGRKLRNVINTRTKAVAILQMELAKIGVNKNNRIQESLIRGSIRRNQLDLPETY